MASPEAVLAPGGQSAWGVSTGAGARAPPRDISAGNRRHVAEGRLFVWCDGDDRMVSMSAWAGPTPNGARVNFVYTPPEMRRRGFASNCVAAVTRRLLDAGRRFIFLFTDLSNPTSDHVCQSLGYAKVGEQQPIHFDRQRER